MSTTQIIVLAIVQGLTEFLPISSSGHLNLVHLLSVWPDEGPLIDVSVHFGSLIAVLVYFWRETFTLIRGALDLLRLR
ncbi:MAG TPA: undecaprenyl-diphosphate phosphatase, partial [Hyphomicrobiales bacterium]|nr:undecaprenyl-diphosphate phosphatase [Hyphomicrobiales bacterium]